MTFQSVALVFILSISTSVISGVITFGDAILFYLSLHLIQVFAPGWFTGMPMIDMREDQSTPLESIEYAVLFKWGVIMLSVRAFFFNFMMVRLVWKEARWDIVTRIAPLGSIGSICGCLTLTHYGASPILPYFFGVTFGTFATVMIGLRLYRTVWITPGSDAAKERVTVIVHTKDLHLPVKDQGRVITTMPIDNAENAQLADRINILQAQRALSAANSPNVNDGDLLSTTAGERSISEQPLERSMSNMNLGGGSPSMERKHSIRQAIPQIIAFEQDMPDAPVLGLLNAGFGGPCSPTINTKDIVSINQGTYENTNMDFPMQLIVTDPGQEQEQEQENISVINNGNNDDDEVEEQEDDENDDDDDEGGETRSMSPIENGNPNNEGLGLPPSANTTKFPTTNPRNQIVVDGEDTQSTTSFATSGTAGTGGVGESKIITALIATKKVDFKEGDDENQDAQELHLQQLTQSQKLRATAAAPMNTSSNRLSHVMPTPHSNYEGKTNVAAQGSYPHVLYTPGLSPAVAPSSVDRNLHPATHASLQGNLVTHKDVWNQQLQSILMMDPNEAKDLEKHLVKMEQDQLQQQQQVQRERSQSLENTVNALGGSFSLGAAAVAVTQPTNNTNNNGGNTSNMSSPHIGASAVNIINSSTTAPTSLFPKMSAEDQNAGLNDFLQTSGLLNAQATPGSIPPSPMILPAGGSDIGGALKTPKHGSRKNKNKKLPLPVQTSNRAQFTSDNADELENQAKLSEMISQRIEGSNDSFSFVPAVPGNSAVSIPTTLEDEQDKEEQVASITAQQVSQEPVTIFGIPNPKKDAPNAPDSFFSNLMGMGTHHHRSLLNVAASSLSAFAASEKEKQLRLKKTGVAEPTAEQQEQLKVQPAVLDYDAIKLNDHAYMARVRKFLTMIAPVGGFFGGLSGIASAPIVSIVVYLQFPKTLARGTVPLLFFSIFIVRGSYTFLSGEIDLQGALPECIAMIAGGMLGLKIGDKLASKLTSDQFILVVTCMLLLAALTLGNVSTGTLLTVMFLEILYCLWEFTRVERDTTLPVRKNATNNNNSTPQITTNQQQKANSTISQEGTTTSKSVSPSHSAAKQKSVSVSSSAAAKQ